MTHTGIELTGEGESIHAVRCVGFRRISDDEVDVEFAVAVRWTDDGENQDTETTRDRLSFSQRVPVVFRDGNPTSGINFERTIQNAQQRLANSLQSIIHRLHATL